MNITRFENFEAAIRLLGGTKVPAELIRALELGVKDVRPEDIVVGDHGIYYLSDDGILTRVLVNIVDKTLSRRYMSADQLAMVESGDFDNDELVESLHKYHVLRCKTLENAEKHGWRDKYKMSHRSDGRFYYRFLENNQVFEERKDQRLYVCKNCLSAAAAAGLVDASVERESFEAGEFLDADDGQNTIGLREQGEFAEQSVPNKYVQDWRLIANMLKHKKKYRCEGLGCPNRDLGSSKLRRFLHAHHRDMDKANNVFSNLEALCVYCHAQQPGHDHMKSSADYLSYRRLLRSTAGGGGSIRETNKG